MRPWLESRSDRGLGIILFLSAGFWGLYWVPLRSLTSAGISDAWSVTILNSFPLIFLLPWLMFNWSRLRANVIRIAVIGAVCGIGLSFYAMGLVASNVVRATILFYLTPVWATIIGVIWLAEPLRTGRFLAIGLGFAGLACLLSGNDENTLPLNIGDLLALLSGVFWAAGAACIKKWPSMPVAGTVTALFVSTAVTSVGLGTFLLAEPLPDPRLLLSALPIVLLASLLILLPTAYLILWISRRLFPGRVGLLMMSEVLVAILSASIFLPEEVLTGWQWAGVVVILAACVTDVVLDPTSGGPRLPDRPAHSPTTEGPPPPGQGKLMRDM
ncbi:MAG: DMT family transporter [Paracoccaceae bacterium]|nr:DMT family transporter [Paracoccaceae bacterium]